MLAARDPWRWRLLSLVQKNCLVDKLYLSARWKRRKRLPRPTVFLFPFLWVIDENAQEAQRQRQVRQSGDRPRQSTEGGGEVSRSYAIRYKRYRLVTGHGVVCLGRRRH